MRKRHEPVTKPCNKCGQPFRVIFAHKDRVSSCPDCRRAVSQFSADEIETVRRRYERGDSIYRIATDLGRSRNSGRYHTIGLARTPMQRPPHEHSKPIAKRQKTTRPCLCCRTPFLSAGPHNRLCNECRKHTISHYEEIGP